jgi:hypothetical protein
VLSWFGILKRLAPDRVTVLIGLAFIAGNYDVMNTGSGRYDPQVAALNAAGIFLYLFWRESNLNRAVFAGNCCLALACVTHPYAVFGMVGFSIFFLFLDRERLSFKVVLLAAVPYFIAFGAWGLYIARYPNEFRAQMASNASGRLKYLTNPLLGLWTDLTVRYVAGFAGFRSGVPVYMRVKVLLLVAYAFGFAACVSIREVRRNAKLAALVTYACACYLLLALIEGQRWYIYLIHALPAYSAVLGVALAYCYRRYSVARLPVIAATTLFVLYTTATVVYRARANEYARIYTSTLDFLRNTVQPGELVMGGASEFGSALGYREHVLVDRTLGYRNGRTPDLFVADETFRAQLASAARSNPTLHQHLERVMSNYELVFASPPAANHYQVYRRRTDAPKNRN